MLREPLIFILPKDNPLAKYERIPIKALNGIDFIIPSVEQSQTLHHTILDFAKANGIEFNIVQKADNILFSIDFDWNRLRLRSFTRLYCPSDHE